MQASLRLPCTHARGSTTPVSWSAFRNECRPVLASRKHSCAAGKDAKWEDSAISMIDKYMGTSSSKSSAPAKQDSPAGREPLGNGVLILLALNFGLFAADKLLHMSWIPNLFLWGKHAQWWQFVTSAFCHANFHHLSTNMFMLYVFGKTVEDEEGAFGVIFSYLFCAVGGCLASYFLMPQATLLGASGACFGLFVISALIKLRFSVRRLLELAAITPFVYEQISSNVAAHIGGKLGNISHVGHLGGAAAGLLLVGLLSLLPAES